MTQQWDKNWHLYERLVAAFETENTGIDVTITPNARIVGRISQIPRQVDVLIDARWGDDISRRIVVDAKLRKTKLDIKDIESFEGMMKDCGAERGILFCPSGWTEGARRRAQDAITIKLLSLDELEETTSWAHFDECLGWCLNEPTAHLRTGLVLWDVQHFLSNGGLWVIIWTGKCDVCHNFHIWCWDCGDKFAVGDEDEHKCFCGRLWVTAVEEEIDDPTGDTLNAVHLLALVDENLVPLDRRRLR